jgi:hypothetical protein
MLDFAGVDSNDAGDDMLISSFPGGYSRDKTSTGTDILGGRHTAAGTTASASLTRSFVCAAPAPAAAAAAAGPAVGVPFSVKMRNGDVARITVVSAVRTDAVATTAFATPAKNGSYLLLDVLRETEAGKTSSNPLYFSAKDASGRKADLSMFADNQLGSGTVLPGDKSRGFVAVDIAPGPVTVMISDPLMQEAARIQIPG